MTYCIVPRDLAGKLHESLRRFYRDDPSVEVVVERRTRDRRRAGDRRSAKAASPGAPARDRRTIRSTEGRRIGERRSSLVPAEAPRLPRRAQRHADRLAFVERLEPSGERLEDRDTARLVMRAQAGDRDAFGDLYMRYFDRVYNYLRVLLKDPHEAEDATQAVFTHLLETLPSYERRREPFRAWLFVVVRNLAISRLRQDTRFEVLDTAEVNRRREREGSVEADLRALDWISDRELLLFVERLPLPQRQVLMLRYMLDLTHSQVAAILGRSPDDVRALHHRAVRFLGARLTAIGRGPGDGSRARALRRVREARVLRSRRFVLGP